MRMPIDCCRYGNRRNSHMQVAEPGIFNTILKHSLHNFCEGTAEHLRDLVRASERKWLQPALYLGELCGTHSNPLTEPRLRQAGFFT